MLIRYNIIFVALNKIKNMKIIGKFPSTRLRRVRNSDWVRRLISENNLSANDLILPILFFIVSLIYSSVGLGGGSAYTALMIIFGMNFKSPIGLAVGLEKMQKFIIKY